MQLSPGTKLGHFEIVSRLGAGGMGEGYEARDVRLDRRVAVKVLPPAVANDSERLRRFVQEARTASNLNHPNIVTIYDVGNEKLDGQDVHYIAMELISGVTLRHWLTERPPLREVLATLARAAEGLARAHAAGVVHRDLKPDNIMITRDGAVKILDFGLARPPRPSVSPDDATEVRDTTREGVILGTVGYMAPEQIEGKTADARSDVFAFGCILYEAFTGRRPFTGRSDIDVLHAVLNTEPVPITDINPNLPVELRRIVKRCKKSGRAIPIGEGRRRTSARSRRRIRHAHAGKRLASGRLGRDATSSRAFVDVDRCGVSGPRQCCDRLVRAAQKLAR